VITTPEAATPATEARPDRDRSRLADVAAAVLLLVGAVWVFRGLWADPEGALLQTNIYDQVLFEWMFQHAASAVTGWHDPFVATMMNVPSAANLAGNTSVVVAAVPLAPITLLFGPGTSVVLFGTLALAGTGFGWYLLMRGMAGIAPVPAFVGGAFCGFAPGVVSQANGHFHFAAQFLVPALIALALRLGAPGLSRRRRLLIGAALGVVTAAQVLLSEEVLFILALALAVFILVYAFGHAAEVRDRMKASLGGAAVAIGVAAVLVAYPLWVQYLGPLAYHGIPWLNYHADLASFTTYATNSLAGSAASANAASPNPSEQTSFFGLPLMIVAVAAAVWLRRVAWLRSAAITAAIFCAASLGSPLTWHEKPIGVSGPWALVQKLPLFRDVIAVRLALVAVPVIGLLIAVAWQKAVEHRTTWVRWAWPVAMAAALLPTAPRSLDVVTPPPVPAFITSGQWRTCAGEGETLVAYGNVRPRDVFRGQMRWQAAAKLAYASPSGYFLARAEDGTGQWGPAPRSLDVAVRAAMTDGTVAPIDPAAQTQARADLAYWRARCVVVEQSGARAAAVRDTVANLLGSQPNAEGGVWYWRIAYEPSA
jgi:hypothetical protein